MMFTLPGGLFVVANASDIDTLRNCELASSFTSSILIPLPPDWDLPQDVISAAQVLVLEVDPSSETSLRRIAKIRSVRGDLPVIAALHQADVTLVRTLIRQGISDVAVLPFEPEELASQILEASAKLAEAAPSAALAPMATVIRSSGGCGATSVVTHLAAALANADTTGRGVCVVDLDLQRGDVASFVGAMPKVTVSELLEAGERLDNELIRSAITETRYGFSVIAAPDVMAPLDTIDVDQLLRVLALVRKKYAHVLIDLPADWTNWALSVAMASTSVLLVTDLSIASLRQAKRRLELLSSIGVEGERITVVANRVERGLFKTIGVDEVGEALHCRKIVKLSDEGKNLRSAADQGVLITDVVNKSRFFNDIQSLANGLAEAGR